MKLQFSTLLLLLSFSIFGQNFYQYVNPMIGTGGHGHTYPGATVPFGMVQLSPDTRIDGSWDGCSGYHYDDPNIYWGNPSYVLEPGDPGYVPPPDGPTRTQNVPAGMTNDRSSSAQVKAEVEAAARLGASPKQVIDQRLASEARRLQWIALADGALDGLSGAVARDADELIGLVLRETLVADKKVHHLLNRERRGDRQIRVGRHADEVGGRFGPRPAEMQVFANHELKRAA